MVDRGEMELEEQGLVWLTYKDEERGTTPLLR